MSPLGLRAPLQRRGWIPAPSIFPTWLAHEPDDDEDEDELDADDRHRPPGRRRAWD